MNIVMVGAGALGANLLFVARNIKADWTVIDFDKVEAKNVLAQFHPKNTIGRNKAQALQMTMLAFFGVRVTPIPHQLNHYNIDQLLGKAGLVLDCTDNQPTRVMIQDFCKANGLPCLHGGLAADGAFAQIAWSENFTPEAAEAGVPTCEDGEHLPFINLATSAFALAVQQFVKDGKRLNFHVWPQGCRVWP